MEYNTKDTKTVALSGEIKVSNIPKPARGTNECKQQMLLVLMPRFSVSDSPLSSSQIDNTCLASVGNQVG